MRRRRAAGDGRDESARLVPEGLAVLALCDALYRAAMARDRERVDALVESAGATAIPAEARAEALAIASASPRSLRAPIHLLQFRERVRRLHGAESPLGDGAPRPDRLQAPIVGADPQLELPLTRGRRRAPRRARR